MMATTLDLTFVASLLIGLFGSVHCVGMCGGIVGALTVALPGSVQCGPRQSLPFMLAYNTGRILSYGLAGALAGLLGATAGAVVLHRSFAFGHLLGATFMIAVGLYIAGWWQGLRRIEALGARLWRRIEPFGRRYLPVRRPAQAFALGIVWGWLPCGLVYSALVLAVAAADPLDGALYMLAFGAGTLPMLLLMGVAGRWLSTLTRRPTLRKVAGALMIAMGLASLVGSRAHVHSATTDRTTHTNIALATGMWLANHREVQSGKLP